MQSNDRLPRTRTAFDDERPAGARADDGVLIGLDGAEHVSHLGRAAAAQAGNEGGQVVERRVPFQPLGAEDLVPVVGDPTTGPAVPAAAGQAHRVGVRRREERLGGRGTPVNQEPTTRGVREAEPSDVRGLGLVRTDHAAEAYVKAEAAPQAQVCGQPVNFQVSIQRRSSLAPRGFALGIELVRQLGDLLLQALRDGCQVQLVASDHRRVGLGGKMLSEG